MLTKIQQFCSKCIRSIVESNNKEQHNNARQSETDEEWKETHKTNQQIRRDNAVPTIESKIYSEKLCCAYRWKSTNANAYLNNQEELEADLSYLNIKCERLKNIINEKLKNNVQTDRPQNLGRLHIFHKKRGETSDNQLLG